MYTSFFRKAMLGDTATLNLDFTTGVLDSRLTFTRAAGTATYINSSGYVTTAAANVARFDYDPVTLAPRGLLIEGSAINLMTYSEDQGNNSTWNAYSTSVTRTTGQTDPENTTTATKILFDATSADAVISRSVTISNATAYTISVWMRADSGTVSNVRFGRAATASGAIFPTLTTTWQRVQLAFTSSGTSDGIEIRVLTSGSPKTATIYIWGAQLEAGSGASSYIPTGASQVTRNADECTATGSNFSSWWPLSQSAFTVYWDGDIARSPANTQFYWLTRAGGSSRSRGYVTTGSLIRANNTAYDFTMSPTTSMTVGTRFRSAVAISSGSSAMYANNSTVTGSDTSAGAVTLFDADSLNFNPNAENFMHIRAFKFYNTRLTNAELLALVS
jgi:hypothetical protein